MSTIRQLRLQARMSIVDLSEASDVSISTINRIERSKGTVTALTVLKLLDAINAKLGSSVSISEVENIKLSDKEQLKG